MWRLWAKLFGWKYVCITFGYSCHVKRVHKDANGNEYAWCCGQMVKPTHSWRGWTPLN